MKTKYFSILIIALSAFALTTSAQKFITTLQHKGTTQVFYGQNSLVEAYNASSKGDTLNLSAGYFSAPSAFTKGITVIGSGHFPDPTGVVEKRTTILSGLNIYKGADSLRLEGLYINGNIDYAPESSINYVNVIRCKLVAARFMSSSATASKNYCSYEECYLDNEINFSHYGNNLLVKHCLVGSINNIDDNAIIDGNVILSGTYTLTYITSSLIKNNVLFGSYATLWYCAENTFNNNIINTDFGANSYSNNYTGVTLAEIFINQTGSVYANDYHLKNPEKYIGTDGTQIGLYGGTTPFKEKGLPSNPQIIKKTIAEQTDASGNLKVDVTVKAQEY
jgi:hypothetical protein